MDQQRYVDWLTWTVVQPGAGSVLLCTVRSSSWVSSNLHLQKKERWQGTSVVVSLYCWAPRSLSAKRGQHTSVLLVQNHSARAGHKFPSPHKQKRSKTEWCSKWGGGYVWEIELGPSFDFRLPMNTSLLSSFTVTITESCYPMNLHFPGTKFFTLNAIEDLHVLWLEFVPVWSQFLRMENILPAWTPSPSCCHSKYP